MAATLQSQSIQVANELMAIGSTLYTLEQTINQVTQTYTQLTMGTVFAAFPTTAVNADGSLGTADGAANAAHVIDTRIAAVSSLARAISANDLASLVTLLQAVAQLLSGGTPPAQQGQAPQLFQKLNGG